MLYYRVSKVGMVFELGEVSWGIFELGKVSFYFEWSDEDASEASIRVAFPSEARKSGA